MARYAKDKKHHGKKIKIISIILALIILAIVGLLLRNKLLDNKNQLIGTLNPITEDEQSSVHSPEIVNVDDIPAKMGKYNVLGKIVIDKIGVDNNILEVCDDDSLKLSVTKFYGPGVNEAGNFVICGHNWGGILKRLSELQDGDTLYMINRETKTKIYYQIVDHFTCGPNDISILDQNEDGKKKVTIYTCTPSGAKRVVYTAKET